jgi:PAS domain S-box-containing protein
MSDTATNRQLRASTPVDKKALLLAVLEQWPGAILLFDADARLHWCNESARQLSPLRREDLRGLGAPGLGLPWVMAPEQFVAALSGSQLQFRAGPTEEPQKYDVRLRRVDLGGVRDAVLCIVEQHATATEEATRSEREQSFDAAQAGMWRWNIQTDEASVDEAWCRHLQLNPCSGADHAHRWSVQIHPDDSADYRRRIAELRSGATAYFEDEYRILTLDNRWVWILQRGRVVARDADGTPQRVIGICIDIDRRKREETASKANEARLATALWGARAAFWQWHLPTDSRTMSPMWFAMTRYTREEWDKLTDPWLSRLHPEDHAPVIKAVEDYRSGVVDSLEYEYRMRVASGEWKWMLDRARAVEWDLEGNPAVIMGVSLDIDAQKRAEMALRASEVRLQTAVWGARMGLWETDLVTNSTRWFDDWCSQYGIDPSEGQDHTSRWLANIHPADAAAAVQRYQDHLDGKQDFYDAECRIRTIEGQWRWIYFSGRVTERDENNTPLRIVGVCMDIDARRRAEMQKHFTQPWLEKALEVARGGMWHWRVEPHEVTYTDSYYRLFGIDPLAGRSQSRFWYDNIHPDDRERASAVANDMMAGKTETYEQEYRMRRADGRWMWVLDRACAMARDERGKAQQLVGFVIDFTERRAQREALRASEEIFRYATMTGGGTIVEVDFITGRLKGFGSERLLGYRSEELGTVMREWEAEIHPDDVALFRAYRSAHSIQGHSTVIEYRVRHKHGHYVRVRGAGVTITDGDGKPSRRISFLQAVEAPDDPTPPILGSKPTE